MPGEKPFIHLFETPLGYYMYDVNKNTVLKIQQNVYEYLKAGQNDSTNSGNEAAETIESLKSKGFLSNNRVSEIVHPSDELLEYHLNNRLEKITLQVTQMCNLRCNYCIYTNPSNEMQRKHSNKKMDLETAKKGIDFLIQHSQDSHRINIGFYGGEPLLEFDFMKECIEYAEEKAEGKDLGFSLTTNGTLIENNIIEYFIKHNVSLTISLDGPKEIHDVNRRFAANGSGTFDSIIKNVEKVKANYPEYYKNILFNMVIDPENDFSCTNEFYTNYEALKESQFNPTFVDDRYTMEKHNATDNFTINYGYECFKYYLYLLGELDGKYVSSIMKQMNSAKKISELLKPTEKLHKKDHHGGPCIPGQRRLFVDINGNFFPCERVSETSEVMKIGHIDYGFDINKARDILNIGKITESSCKDCWAFRHCTMCAASADNLKNLSAGLKRLNCADTKFNIEESLRNYTTLREFGYNFD